jgi:phosphoglycolate phosphatase
VTVIALDLDGTLVDSRQDMVAAIHAVRAQFGMPERTDDAVRPWVSRGMNNLYRNCFDEMLKSDPSLMPNVRPYAERYAEVRDAYEAEYLAHVTDTTLLYPGIAEVLPLLAAKATLACVTNKPEHISRALLAGLGVIEHFSAVVGGDTCAAPKPDPVMLRTAVEKVSAPGSARSDLAVFHCGDSNGDMKMAAAYGATRVWCAWGYYDAIEQPFDRQFATPMDLVRLLD